MLDSAHEDDGVAWFVEISMVDADESMWKLDAQYYLASTKDGGLSAWLPEIGGSELKKWASGSTSELEYAQLLQTKIHPSTDETKLKAHCHCGGFEFYISPPRDLGAHQGLPSSMTPADKSKWHAVLDVCNSCRLVSGCAVIGWAFPKKSHITLVDGSPWRPDCGTLKTYKSSEGVDRSFCGTCGAVLTYTCDERPGFVDVAVGLLDAESGVRAEEWLEWRTYGISYEEDCNWKLFRESMKSGLKSHGEGVD